MQWTPINAFWVRPVDFVWLQRQMIWISLTDFAMAMAPMMRIYGPVLQRQLMIWLMPLYGKSNRILVHLPPTDCAYCRLQAPDREEDCKCILPTEMECGHVFCYVCAVKAEQAVDVCPRCFQRARVVAVSGKY